MHTHHINNVRVCWKPNQRLEYEMDVTDLISNYQVSLIFLSALSSIYTLPILSMCFLQKRDPLYLYSRTHFALRVGSIEYISQDPSCLIIFSYTQHLQYIWNVSNQACDSGDAVEVEASVVVAVNAMVVDTTCLKLVESEKSHGEDTFVIDIPSGGHREICQCSKGLKSNMSFPRSHHLYEVLILAIFVVINTTIFMI